jgi:two-component system, OmpR family, KDP operon response regulator KdpE
MSAPAPTVLLIEDDRFVRRFVRVSIESAGLRVLEAESGEQGLALASTARPDLVIVNLGLPDMDGVEVIRELRGWSSIPVIVVSAHTREDEKVAALDAGADDYVTKPFGIAELVARIRAHLRRQSRITVGASQKSRICFGAIEVDLGMRVVKREGKTIHLTPIEYRLLLLLIANAERVLTQEQLLKDCWGPGYTHSAQYLRVYMAHLRRKLERDPAQPECILTETGIGYRLTGVR